MTFPVLQSASNTAIKTLGTVDNVVDTVSLGSEIIKDAMLQARFEQKSEMFTEANRLRATNSDNHSDAQKELLNQYIPA